MRYGKSEDEAILVLNDIGCYWECRTPLNISSKILPGKSSYVTNDTCKYQIFSSCNLSWYRLRVQRINLCHKKSNDSCNISVKGALLGNGRVLNRILQWRVLPFICTTCRPMLAKFHFSRKIIEAMCILKFTGSFRRRKIIAFSYD